MVLSACFDEDTYLICSLRIYAPEPIHFTFSSVAPVVRRNILELPDYSLSMMDGLQHAWSVTFGEEKYVRNLLFIFDLFHLVTNIVF